MQMRKDSYMQLPRCLGSGGAPALPSSVAVVDHPVLHRREHLLETLMEGPNRQHLTTERQHRFNPSGLGEGGDATGEVAVHAPQQYGMDLGAVLQPAQQTPEMAEQKPAEQTKSSCALTCGSTRLLLQMRLWSNIPLVLERFRSRNYMCYLLYGTRWASP